MEIAVPVKKENLSKAKLTLLRTFLKGITDLEITIVAAMLDKKISSLNRDNKSLLMRELNIGVYNFNNYIKKMADKGIIYIPEGAKNWTLNPRVIQITKDDTITVVLQPYE